MLDIFFDYDQRSIHVIDVMCLQAEEITTKVDLPGIPKGSKFAYVIVDFNACTCSLISDVIRQEVTLKIKFALEA
jgi:hypothetical protein